MKSNKLVSVLAIILAVFTLAACNKDRQVVKNLEGEWKITAMTRDGKAVDKSDYEGVTYKFNACDGHEDCGGSVNFEANGSPVSVDFKYTISDGGEKIVFKPASGETTTSEIKEHSKSKFVISRTKDNVETITTLEKK
jgi:hypothetical protein